MVDGQTIYRESVIRLFEESMIFHLLFTKKNDVQFMEHLDLRDTLSLFVNLYDFFKIRKYKLTG